MSVALSISPASSAGTACRVRSMQSSMASRWSGAGFLSTQLITSAFTPGWPMPMRSRQ
jgi:hypothetical protein